MKRVLALLLCLCMIFTMVPAVSAQNENVGLVYGETTTYYDTVEAALDDAVDGSRVFLLTNVTAGQVVVKPNVLLDLNGYNLTADMVIAAGGGLYDGSNGAGKVIVQKENLAVVSDDNGQLPLWDPEDHCYILANVSYQQMLNLAEDKSYAQYIFVPNFSGKALELLKNGSQDNGVSVKVYLSWNQGASQQIYTFSQELVDLVYGSANASGTLGKVFQLTVTGIADIRDMTVWAQVETTAGGAVGSRMLPAFGQQEIVDQAYGLGANESLPYQATLTGVITDIVTDYDAQYKNVTVTMAVEGREDKPVLCYRLVGENADKIGIDDVITVTGNILNYVNADGQSTIEFTVGCQLKNWVDNPGPVVPEDPKQIVDEAYALGANEKLKYKATLTGTITVIDSAYSEIYGNITVTMVVEGREDKPIRCYRMKGDSLTELEVGDLITVNGYIKNYVNSEGSFRMVEFDAPTLLSYEKTEKPDAPVPEGTLTIEQAIALGASKPHNNFTTDKYYVTGVITEVYNAKYGNMRIADENGNILTIYGSYNADGSVRYDAMSVKPAAGDTVTVYGILGQYSGTVQMKNGWIVAHIPAGSDPEPDSQLTITEAIALGTSKAHNGYTSGKYYVTGVITEVYQSTYGNMYIADENGNILTIYGTYSADGSVRYDAMTVKPVAGDTVTIYGIVGQYNGVAQIKSGWITQHIPYVPEVTPEPEPESEFLVVATCDCGDRFADANEDALCDVCKAHAHRYLMVVTEPNCTQQGYTNYTCSCEDSYTDNYIAVSGKHIDKDKDKVCDECSLSVIVELDFYSVNDLHGAFIDTDSQPGVDELSTYIKQKYADDSTYEILLSAGDMWQGSVESSSNKGALMTEWMNEMDFVSMTIGNHEYDWGSSYISANMKNAAFPLLGINIRENGKMPDYCQSSTTVERGGVKIGIIGAMGNYVSSISGEFNQNLSFLSGSSLTTLVKNESTRLRQEEGCDLVIYAIHGDQDDYDDSLSNGYIDLVFEGHSHQSYIKTDSYGVVHIQSGGYNDGVSFVNIAYNVAEDTYAVETTTNLSNSVYGKSSIADDPFVAQVYKTYFPSNDPYTTVLGRNTTTRSSGVIEQKVADQYLAFGEEYWSEYDIVLAGGSLNTRPPYKLYSGNVTYAQLYTLLPFDNSLVLGKISGSKLKQKFINGSYTTATGDGMPATIQDSKTYYIIVDTYTAYYASNGITIVDRYDNYYARDLLADFIKAGGWG